MKQAIKLCIAVTALCLAISSCGIDLEEYDGVKAMAAGGETEGAHTVALKNDGTLWAWGSNRYGQLGDGTGGVQPVTNDKSSPVQVGADYWVAVAAGYYHTVAIKNDGTLWTWGRNGSGQLGHGTIGSPGSDKNSPVQEIRGDKDWSAVAAGGNHTLAIKNDGTLWAWGNNGYGQLGDGTKDSSVIPKQVVTDKKWRALSVSLGHIVAIDTDDNLWSWGWNGNGQLGDGNTAGEKTSPDKVFINSDKTTQFSNVK
ncbi:MAG: hypothetical protein FWG92_05215, partial [Leptospirales bacterium]|nr:hypothetical protein [Leptospirales bacterium]